MSNEPSEPDMETEWLVFMERMRQEPDHWVHKRWRLTELDPSPAFKTEFMRLVAELGSYVHPAFGWSLRAYVIRGQIDHLVSAERSRLIRERLVRPVSTRQRPLRQGFTADKYLDACRKLQKRDRTWSNVATRLQIDHDITVSTKTLPQWVREVGQPPPRDVK